MFADRLQMQDLQAKVAHYEAMAARTQKNIDEQNAQAAEELKRISQLALAERDQYCARVDNDVKELRNSMQQTIDQQRKVVIAEFQSQVSEALLRQRPLSWTNFRLKVDVWNMTTPRSECNWNKCTTT